MASIVEQDAGSIAGKRVFWANILTECNLRLGPAPRRRFFWLRLIKPSLPEWAAADPIRKMEEKRWTVLSKGNIVWAHLVQANVALFEPSSESAPAGIVFSPNPSVEVNPDYLADFAEQLYALKADASDSEKETDFYKYIQSGLIRAKGILCPIANHHGLMVSTILVNRSDLPYGFLTYSFFPVAAFPDGTVSIVPKRYWPKALIQCWTQDSDVRLKWKVFGQSFVLNASSVVHLLISLVFLGVVAAIGLIVEKFR